MKKIIILISFLSLMLQSCQSQSSFDLAKITCKESVSKLLPKGTKYDVQDYYLNPDYTVFEIYDSNILNYNGVNLEGRIYPKSNFMRNNVVLCFSKKSKDSILSLLEINTYTAKESDELIETLKNQLGIPNYTHYEDKNKKDLDIPNGFVWEKKEQNLVYFIQIKDSRAKRKNNKELSLNLVKLSDKYVYQKMLDFPTFQYYSDFIDDRNRKKEDNYTYKQFIINQTKGGTAEYYNYYTK